VSITSLDLFLAFPGTTGNVTYSRIVGKVFHTKILSNKPIDIINKKRRQNGRTKRRIKFLPHL
jgi:hypothetical protein